MIVLSTARLVVRRFTDADAAALAAYRSEPEVARYQSWTAPVSVAQAAELIREFAEGTPDAPGWFQYAVARRDAAGLIGDIGVNLHDNRMQADLGFTFATASQGRGYATEATAGLIDHLFARGLKKISAECDARNVRSARLLERLRFQQEGRRRRHTWIKGEWTDDLLFGRLAED